MKSRLAVLALLFSLFAPLLHAAEALVVYSGRKDTFVQPLIDTFTARTGIPVTLHAGEATALLNKLRLEGGRTDADVFLTNDAGNLQLGAQWALFATLPEAVLRPVPAQFRAADASWVGLSGRTRVLVVNGKAKDLDFVRSVFDLADPRLKGRLAITNSSNESFIAGLSVYTERKGRDAARAWLQGLKDNAGGETFAKHSQIVTAVAEGQKDIGLVNHYYVARHLAEHPGAPIRLLLPDQEAGGMGVASNVTGAAIVKSSRHQDAAAKFLEFLVSEEGQKMYADANLEYPVRAGVQTAPGVPAAGSFKVAEFPMQQLGAQRDAALDLIETVGMP